MSAWQPIETAPKDGRSILTAHVGTPGVEMVSWIGGKKRGGWATESGHALYSDGLFTHWMPLPPAPQEKGRG